ncbi:hypothetical protein KY284_030263 [Solanum tuberosum]|nr:hypothetical protein KY284_030263 [Solanum tuberosum]
MFKALRSEFKDIVTALSTRQEHVTFRELHSLLLSHEFIHGQALSSLSISPSTISDLPSNPFANFSQCASQNESQYNQQNHRGRGRNSKRGRGGNRGGRQGYHNSSSTGNHWSSPESRSRCQICNGVNHLAPNCFQRYNHMINPSTYLTHQSPHIEPQNWYPDSGASHHITPDLASLHHVEDYNGMDQVQVGNGQGLPIHHTINSTLSLPSKSLALTNILHDRASKKPLLSGQSNDGLYSLKLQPSQPRAISKSPYAFISSRTASTCWHLRLGHPHKRVLHQCLPIRQVTKVASSNFN